MLQRTSVFDRLESKSLFGSAVSVLFALSCSVPPTLAQQPGQRTFASARDAGRALLAAMQASDEKSLLSILGPAGKDIISSGDPTEDLDHRSRFVAKYQEMHRFVTESNGTVTLVVGAENWPLPIPLVNSHGAWYFDTLAGRDEILFRRVGKNEMAAMDACRELVEAQKQYFARPPGHVTQQFAQKLVSDEGRHNGLYWQEADNEFESPIDPLIAHASGKGPSGQGADPVPFNGYLFRILTRQGRHAPGGAKDYLVDGKMTAGFAFVAYPVEYRSSGVMTFIGDGSGAIYEKDLGAGTSRLVEAMIAYDPDSTWKKAE